MEDKFVEKYPQQLKENTDGSFTVLGTETKIDVYPPLDQAEKSIERKELSTEERVNEVKKSPFIKWLIAYDNIDLEMGLESIGKKLRSKYSEYMIDFVVSLEEFQALGINLVKLKAFFHTVVSIAVFEFENNFKEAVREDNEIIKDAKTLLHGMLMISEETNFEKVNYEYLGGGEHILDATWFLINELIRLSEIIWNVNGNYPK